MKKIILIFLFCISLNKELFAETEKYKETDCKKIYEAIGYFLKLADKEWKKKREEGNIKGLFYSDAASNYAQIFDVFCK